MTGDTGQQVSLEPRATGLTGNTGATGLYRSHWSHRHDWGTGQQVSLEPQGTDSLATLEQQGSLATLSNRSYRSH